jgi:murein L,D-transpeptidase YafK
VAGLPRKEVRPMHAGHAILVSLLLSGSVLAADRVDAARKSRAPAISRLFAGAGVAYPPGEILVRAFKREGELELWAGDGQDPLTMLRRYRVCAASGQPGPKRRQGDLQVPEGFYEIDRFNPYSSFHLSLGINYPNLADRAREGKGPLGGDIFIHGDCVTVGCLPLGNEAIEELYLIALDARTAGQRRVPVHIFPSRLDDASFEALRAEAKPDPELQAFWASLRPGYLAFEETRRAPKVRIDPRTGRYDVTVRKQGRW